MRADVHRDQPSSVRPAEQAQASADDAGGGRDSQQDSRAGASSVRQEGGRPGSHIVQQSCIGGLAMANEIQVLPQVDPSLLNVLNLAHQTHRAFQNWHAQHPNDVFFRSHWDDIDNLDTGIVDIKCKIADLIAYSLVDHLQ